MKQQNITCDGIVERELGNSMFQVQLDTTGYSIVCTISGKIRKNFIRISTGDKVTVEMSPYDLTKGRIVTRLKVSRKDDKDDDNINFSQTSDK